MSIVLALILLVALADAWIRLAPSDPARWHVALAGDDWPEPGQVEQSEGSARARLAPAPDQARDMLARLDTIALATPRTRRLAGSPAEGRITWITRSALWGFPDYTTAAVAPDGLRLYARLRFGRGDLGVNAARLRRWLAAL